jgi:hypothetical protein
MQPNTHIKVRGQMHGESKTEHFLSALLFACRKNAMYGKKRYVVRVTYTLITSK